MGNSFITGRIHVSGRIDASFLLQDRTTVPIFENMAFHQVPLTLQGHVEGTSKRESPGGKVLAIGFLTTNTNLRGGTERSILNGMRFRVANT